MVLWYDVYKLSKVVLYYAPGNCFNFQLITFYNILKILEASRWWIMRGIDLCWFNRRFINFVFSLYDVSILCLYDKNVT